MKKVAVLVLVLFSLSYYAAIVRCAGYEIDMTVGVTKVIDGDTFDVATGDRIRLADLNAPELDTPGYDEAKNYLSSLISGKTVYLDVDDVHRYDTTGTRLVCVVYVDYNSTHCLNTNKALLAGGYSVFWDHDNEFNPYSWTLYVPKNQGLSNNPDYTFIIFAAAIIMLVLTLVFLSQRRGASIERAVAEC